MPQLRGPCVRNALSVLGPVRRFMDVVTGMQRSACCVDRQAAQLLLYSVV
jgi:hypothetical protein